MHLLGILFKIYFLKKKTLDLGNKVLQSNAMHLDCHGNGSNIIEDSLLELHVHHVSKIFETK